MSSDELYIAFLYGNELMTPLECSSLPKNIIINCRIIFSELGRLFTVEVIVMSKNPKEAASATDAKKVKQQNQQAAQGQQQQQNQQNQQQNQYGTEFASETDAQQVKMQNQKSQQNKK